jgi:phage-related protein
MGFLDFLKGIGSFVKSGIQKVAGFVGKIAPVVQGIAGAIPTPLTQGIASAAGAVNGIANGVNGVVNGTDQSQVPAGTVPPEQQQQVQQQIPAGTAPAPQQQGPIM